MNILLLFIVYRLNYSQPICLCQDSFMAKVALQGYEYNNYYDDFVYEISSFKRYKVDSEFPKLTHKDLPTAIRKASYEISLVEIANFEIKEGGI